MKNLKCIFSFLLLTTVLGCSDDPNSTDFINDVDAPKEISALFTITQDNTGLVTIRPNGEGVTSYEVYFGDVAANSETIAAGESVDHIYAEGEYTVTIVAMGINGLETEYSQQLTVTFRAPEFTEVVVAPQVGNAYQVNVSAKANYETYFEVFFGEDPSETPVQFNEGDVISHVYSAVGTYQVRVVAYSGGVATTESVQSVTIFDPLLMPVDFESPTLNYAFGDFGGAFTTVVNNPEVSSGNPSAKVAKLTKTPGAEVWAGTTLLIDQPIDFSTMQTISIRSYSPIVGAVIKFKLENATNANLNTEVDAVTTVANDWETLTFDFTGINNASNYQRLVVFYDFGNNGTGAEYFFDDIKLISGQPVVELPLTFESASLVYTFNNFGGANSSIINNPNVNGINTSSKVARLIKDAGSQTWAGSAITMAAPIDFSTMTKIKVKVWSPQAGMTVLLKLENASATNPIEIPATTTVANAWQELTFDFAGINNNNNYQTVVIFMDFGAPGTGATYYFDDIQLSN